MITNKNSVYFSRIVIDFFLLNISFAAAAVFAQSFELFSQNKLMFVLMLILNITWFFSANIMDFYDDAGNVNLFYDIVNVIKNSLVQIFITVFYLFIIKENLFTRYFVLYYFIFLAGLISLKKIAFIIILKRLRKKNYLTRKILLVGFSEIGQNFYHSFARLNSNDYRIIGYLDEETSEQLPRLGGIDGLEGLIDSGAVDDVVIALPNSQFGVIEKLIKICNRHAVRTHIIPDYFKFISRKFRISILEDVPLITVRDEPLAEFHWKLIKRVIDIAGSLFVIVFVLSWLLPLVSVIQRFTSPGPVFFIQDRIGQRNRIFRCLKFRSMSVEASKKNEIIAIVKDDPRVTRFGRFLRKTNLDEFPQFINVLLGDMSLVGPRPSAVSYNELYKEYVEELKLRHIVKPGITGWAQVNGLRGDVPDETENRKRIKKRFDYDLWYIENWTLLLDLRIAFMTVWQIIRRNNQGM